MSMPPEVAAHAHHHSVDIDALPNDFPDYLPAAKGFLIMHNVFIKADVCLYDNDCNALKTIMKSGYDGFFENIALPIDAFHYKTHKDEFCPAEIKAKFTCSPWLGWS